MSEAQPVDTPDGSHPQGGPPGGRSGPSRKAIIGWTLAMLAALGLAWFVGAVVVPVWQVRSIVAALAAGTIDSRTAIEQLGGPERAAGRLTLYLNLPKRFRHKLPEQVVDNRMDAAAFLLFDCGPPGAQVVPGLLRSRDPEVLKALAWGLDGLRYRRPNESHPWLDPDLYTRTLAGLVRVADDESIGGEDLRFDLGDGLVALLRVRPVPGIPEAAFPHLIRALGAVNLAVRCAAIEALSDSGDPRAQPALEAMLTDGEHNVSSAAMEALEKIKAPSTSSGQGAQEKEQKQSIPPAGAPRYNINQGRACE